MGGACNDCLLTRTSLFMAASRALHTCQSCTMWGTLHSRLELNCTSATLCSTLGLELV